MLGSTRENFLVVLVGVGKVEKARALFNDASLEYRVILESKKRSEKIRQQ